MASRVVFLFTKPPRSGRVKTRLIGALSPEQAAQLQAAIVEDLLAKLAPGRFELRLAWALEEGDEMPESSIKAVRQSGSDLGERLFDALATAARESPVVGAIGSDHPALSSGEIEEAFEVLEAGAADVVFGPALDGGYYLIAARRAAVCAELFHGIPWSTARVLDETLERCTGLGLRTYQLTPVPDVDTPADLERLAAGLASGVVRSPRTAALMSSWGLISELEGR